MANRRKPFTSRNKRVIARRGHILLRCTAVPMQAHHRVTYDTQGCARLLCWPNGPLYRVLLYLTCDERSTFHFKIENRLTGSDLHPCGWTLRGRQKAESAAVDTYLRTHTVLPLLTPLLSPLPLLHVCQYPGPRRLVSARRPPPACDRAESLIFTATPFCRLSCKKTRKTRSQKQNHEEERAVNRPFRTQA